MAFISIRQYSTIYTPLHIYIYIYIYISCDTDILVYKLSKPLEKCKNTRISKHKSTRHYVTALYTFKSSEPLENSNICIIPNMIS
jgi:hypothetical protein